MRVLRRHGMNDQALQAVYGAIVLAKLLNFEQHIAYSMNFFLP